MSNVFLLDGGIDDDFFFLGGISMHLDGCGQNAFKSLGAYALAEVNHVRRSNWGLPLENRFARKVLVIRVLHPSLDNRLVAQIEHMLQQIQSHHKANGFGGTTEIRI